MLVEEKLIFNAEAIRDTSSHDTAIIDIRWGKTKSMIFENTLDQDVSFSVYGSRNADMSNKFLRASFTVGTGTSNIQDCACYFPYLQVSAVCAVAPTTGSLTVAIYTMGAE